MENEGKVFVSGKGLLPKEKRLKLEIEIRARKLQETNELSNADVVIVVIGESTRARCAEAREAGKPFFLMRVEMDSIFASSLIGEAILPEDAAEWAWSVVNEPEKWRKTK